MFAHEGFITTLFRQFRTQITVGLAGGIIAFSLVDAAMAQEPQLLPDVNAVDSQESNDRVAIDATEVSETTDRMVVSTDVNEVVGHAVYSAHAACFDDDPFPAAQKCGVCHPKHYKEWSVSPHSYAQMSPVFNAFQNAENELLHGTLGDFCIRCHTPVGMALQEPRGGTNMDRYITSREGITCVVCHRISQPNSRGSGRASLVAGGTHQVVYGSLGSEILEEVLANPDEYGVLKSQPDPTVRGRDIHSTSYRFFQLTTSGFCGQCHDVLFPLGFRLEDAFSEYKSSPAARQCGQQCQDCHMGTIQGRPSGYFFEPTAVVGNKSTRPRKRTSHVWAGPDFSVVHPGIFPHNPAAQREEGDHSIDGGLATLREWIVFDWKGGWGTKEYEAEAAKHKDWDFGPWQDPARRIKARDILHDQFATLAWYKRKRIEVLREGFGLSQIHDIHADEKGIHFKVDMTNLTLGHGVPTGFDGERPIYLQVVVWDRNEHVVFRSGDLDPNGDYRDDHSFFVHNGEIPRDRQLASLQSKFITRNIRGNEREQILPIPYSLNPLNFDRPATRPFTPLGRPLGARKHKQLIMPCGEREAKYHVPAEQLTGCGPYYINIRLMAGMVPNNLVKTIEFTGFDYGMSSREVSDAITQGQVIVREVCGVVDCHCE